MTEDAMAGDAARKDSAKRHRANLRLWKKLQPNRQMTWDSKVDYEPIGKEPDSDYDEVSFPSLAPKLCTFHTHARIDRVLAMC